MKSIFIVVRTITETRSHGDYGSVKKLATYDGYNEKPYPAFLSKKDAQVFIDSVEEFFKPDVLEMAIEGT